MDLSLDAGDPLHLLLNLPIAVDDGVSPSAEWAQLSALWPDEPPLDLTPAIDPAALHFKSPLDLPIFPELISQDILALDRDVFTHDPTLDLAERVRQSTGIAFALPIEGPVTSPLPPVAPSAPPPPAKLPIPRLPRRQSNSKPHSPPSSSSAASTPPPSTPSPPPSVAPASRPKTSHTTIERRYRTNLNARIHSLRMAVPALRVVEDRAADAKKRAPNKVLVPGPEGGPVPVPGAAAGVVDVIDERGYVDGVKVARKCSKANVLGKAVEYIRVLKRREIRLRNEQRGLKALVHGLVGGPALLGEWERQWRERFGGEERDEIDTDNDAIVDDDDDDDEDDEDEEDAAQRKRKRPKPSPVQPSPPPPVIAKEKKDKKPFNPPAQCDANGNPIVPEKRKRGRPRKIPVPTPPGPADIASTPVQPMMDGIITQPSTLPQAQYLLAVFAVFSFFNSPLTFSSTPPAHAHTHVGTVLNAAAAPPAHAPVARAVSVGNVVHAVHLLASLAVLCSFFGRWLGTASVLRLLTTYGMESKTNRTLKEWVRVGEECVLGGSDETKCVTRLKVYRHLTANGNSDMNAVATAALAMYGMPGTVLGPLAKSRARALWLNARVRCLARPAASTVYERMVLEEMSVDDAFERISVNKQEMEEDDGLLKVLARGLVLERMRRELARVFVRDVRGDSEEKGRDDQERELEAETADRERTVVAAREVGGEVGVFGARVERVCTGAAVDIGGREKEGMEGEIEALLSAIVLHRRVVVGTHVTVEGRGRLLTPPSSPNAAVKELGMLRRVLGSRVFEEGVGCGCDDGNDTEVNHNGGFGVLGLEDARDRVVDVVVELERKSVRL